MPRSVELLAESSATVGQIQSAYGDENYWLARLAAFGGTMSLDSLIVDDEGNVSVSTTQDLAHEMLPGLLAKVYPGDLKIVRNETWRPVDHSRVRGEVTAKASGLPGSCVGSALLAPMNAGSRLDFTATVSVKLPLVGGRIENHVGGQLARGIPAIQRFTTEWITDHG
jgi:hypothetical protein